MKRNLRRTAALMLALMLTLTCACSSGGAPSSGEEPGDGMVSFLSGSESFSQMMTDEGSGGEEAEDDGELSEEESPEEDSRESGQTQPLAGGETQEISASSSFQETQKPQEELPQTGASEGEGDTALKDPTYTVLSPVASGTEVYGNSLVTIDASNTSEGYVMIKYTGNSSKVRVLITPDGGSQYTYTIRMDGGYDVFPLSSGSGGYTIGVYENIGGNQYSTAFSQYITASLRASTLPFLYPNQYVNFWAGCNTVNMGAELSRSAQSDLQIVENVYNYVINNISYDFYKAQNFGFGYLPSVDNILATGKGICFDYAAVMAAMLRSQMIPTKLVVGYAGNIYHAWISTYITDVGWVNGIIYFDGQSWVRMDPTFASSGNSSPDIMAYIGNGSNYNAMFYY